MLAMSTQHVIYFSLCMYIHVWYIYAWKSLLHEFESRHIHDQLINVVLAEESYPQIPEQKRKEKNNKIHVAGGHVVGS